LDRILDEDQRLVEPAVRQDDGLVEDQPDPVAEAVWLSRRTIEEIAPADPFIFASWIQLVAHGTLGDVQKSAVRACGRLDGSSDVAALLAGIAQTILCLVQSRVRGVTLSVQYVADGFAMIGGQLEIRAAFPVAVNTLEGTLWVNPNLGVLDQVVPDPVCTSELFGTIGFIHNADLIPWHVTPRLGPEAISHVRL